MLKKIDKLISLAFWAPFLLTYAVVLFILLTVFMSHYFEDLVGKDLGWEVYVKLFFYFGVALTPQALPLAVLLSSLMAFGNLGEHYEIIALKSAGVSLTRLLIPVGFFAIIISYGALLFNDQVAPLANLKAYSLMYDVRQKKPTLEFKEGGFYNDLPDYKIRIEKKSRQDSSIYGVMIYDHSAQRGNTDLIIADTGKMYTIYDNNFLVMELRSGVRYAEHGSQFAEKKEFVRDQFEEAKFVFSLEALGMQQTKEELFKSHKIMKDIKELRFVTDSLVDEGARQFTNMAVASEPYFDYMFAIDRKTSPASDADSVPDFYLAYKPNLTPADFDAIYERAINKAQQIKTYAAGTRERIKYYDKEARSFGVEMHKRYSTSVACFMMFLIGAPLGSIIKKGGLGVPVLISIIFFLIYYFVSLTAEKYAKEAIWDVVFGTWLANIVLLVFGLFFLNQARHDSRLFDADAYIVMWQQLKRRFTENKASLNPAASVVSK